MSSALEADLAEARASTPAQMALPIEAIADTNPSHHTNVSTMPPAVNLSKTAASSAIHFYTSNRKNSNGI